MKECLRIFSEFTRSKAHKGETAKGMAHTAKFDVPIGRDITGPFRGPVPPLISHTGILQAQQQSVQIMAAIKGDQAFVAATSGQKKSTFACPASQIQRKASGENSCTSNSLHVDIMLKYNLAHPKQALGTSESLSKVPDEKYLRFYKTEDEAFNKAKIGEKATYKHCGSQNIYVNIAINILKKLRGQDVSGSSNDKKTTGLKKNEKKNVLTGIILYRHLKDYLLTEEQLHGNNYPQPNPDKPGSVLLNSGMTKNSCK
ncbi:hypothetical protein DBR06_SOUSAS38510005 [Sousa chinensis]|uniref:RNA exonuclease 1 homolog-like domain-containing protein n=1 Tax=Sousa chinensis TaxID=103600 RepID=A0A484H1G7_SOUCH|nr:hypothetical protein DBR06_SOUSAS38510005 [Sousa chinensis]